METKSGSTILVSGSNRAGGSFVKTEDHCIGNYWTVPESEKRSKTTPFHFTDPISLVSEATLSYLYKLPPYEVGTQKGWCFSQKFIDYHSGRSAIGVHLSGNSTNPLTNLPFDPTTVKYVVDREGSRNNSRGEARHSLEYLQSSVGKKIAALNRRCHDGQTVGIAIGTLKRAIADPEEDVLEFEGRSIMSCFGGKRHTFFAWPKLEHDKVFETHSGNVLRIETFGTPSYTFSITQFLFLSVRINPKMIEDALHNPL